MNDTLFKTMWLKLCVLALCGIYSTRSVEISPPQSSFYVSPGAELKVSCTSPNSVGWTRDKQPIPANAVTATVKGGENSSTLTLKNVQSDSQDTYRCKEDGSMTEKTFQLFVLSVAIDEAEFEFNVDALLSCVVEDTSKTYTYTWKKGEKDVGDIKVDPKQKFLEHENGTLEIQNPARSLAGEYTCRATFQDAAGADQHVDTVVKYKATPKVIPFEKSKNLVQDETLVIECKVLGYPKPTIVWFKEMEEIKADATDSFYKLMSAKTYNDAMIENGKLQIDSVDFDDAGKYTCMAKADTEWPNFNSTQDILVRVKDKLAALWPFLGIVAEVVILCTIIFIYEKKRNKDSADDDNQNDDGAAQERKPEGVRHRGSSNNPRA